MPIRSLSTVLCLLVALAAGGAPAAAATAEPVVVAQADAPPTGDGRRLDVDIRVGEDRGGGVVERDGGGRGTTWIIGLSTVAAILLVLVLVALARGDRRRDARDVRA